MAGRGAAMSFLEGRSAHAQHAVAITAAVGAFTLLTKLIDGHSDASALEKTLGRQLLDQSKQFYSLSVQDRKPMLSLEHATFALAYLNAARHVVHDAVLEQTSGVNIHALLRSITQQQQQASRELAKSCPKIKSKPTQLSWL